MFITPQKAGSGKSQNLLFLEKFREFRGFYLTTRTFCIAPVARLRSMYTPEDFTSLEVWRIWAADSNP